MHTLDRSCVREWLILGPFVSPDMEFDFLASAGGEANIRPKEGDTVLVPDGKSLTWKRVRAPHDVVNLEQLFGIANIAVAYAYCELQIDQGGEMLIRALANDTTLVKLNGVDIGSIPTQINLHRDPPLLACSVQPGRHACLLKLKGGRFEWNFFFQPLPATHAAIQFQITDPGKRQIPGALVEIYSDGKVASRTESDASGIATAYLFPVAESYDVRVTSATMGSWLLGLKLRPGERRRIEVPLAQALSITGQVAALDGSPQNAIVVQALRLSDEPGRTGEPARDTSSPTHSTRDSNGAAANAPTLATQPRNSGVPQNNWLLSMPPFSETVLTDTNGNFRFVNLRPGKYQLRGHGPDGFVTPESVEEMNANGAMVFAIGPGQTHEGVRFRFAETRKGVWKSFPITLGFREAHPFSIHRAPGGLLWVGTDESFVQTFDGLEFKTVAESPQIPASHIHDLQHAPDGAVWIGTGGGIVRIAEGRTETIPLNENLPRKTVRDVAADADGTLWFASESGLLKFDRRNWKTFTTREGLPGNVIRSLYRSRKGPLWLGTSQGLTRFDGQTFTLVQPTLDLLQGVLGRILESRDGAIWFTTSHGAYRFDGQSVFRLGKEHGLLSDEIFDVAETSDRTLWFATGNGLSSFNGSTVVNYTPADGLSNEWVRRIVVDEEDVLWCANGWGISRFDWKGFVTFTKKDGLSNGDGETASVLTIKPHPEGGAWVGTAWAGIFRISGQKLESLVRPDERPYVRAIHRAADGTIWLGGSPFGIGRYDGQRVAGFLKRDWVTALCTDHEGNLWFGEGWYGGGLTRHNLKTGETTVFTTADGLPNDGVWSVIEGSPGEIWVGTENGLARVREGKIEDFREQLGVPTGCVFNLQRDTEEALWISSRLGLHRWRGGQRISITSKDGLPDQHLWSSARTPDGIIWMGSDHNGLLGYDGQAVTVIDKRDGLSGNQVLSVLLDADDSLLAGFLDSGLSRYRPAKTPPLVRLVSMQLNDQVVTNFARLPPILTGNRLTFEYREVDLKTHPEKRQFRYQLTGHSGAPLFTAVTKDRRFDWTPQDGGAYTFQVQAIDRDLSYSLPARLSFKVHVPWYANPWILVPLVGLFGGLLVWAFIARALYLRKSREAAVLRERVRISRDLHDHLGAGLTDLALAGDLVRQHIENSGTAQKLALRLSASARELTRTMGEVIWMTDPEKDTLQSFVSFVSSYAERYFAGSSIRLRFEMPSDIPDLVLPEKLRRELFLVLKEALNNVAKHADASELRLKLELRGHELHLHIEDNGRGFQLNQVASDRRGLRNMHERFRDLGGQLEIESVP
ncbi:MAG: two-component regulator propeller domain-containing protein, partial [Verrucomicrobiota bacterium]